MTPAARRKVIAAEKKYHASLRKTPEQLLGITKKRPRKVSVKISRKYDLDLASALHEAAEMFNMAKAPKKRTSVIKKLAKVKPPKTPRYNTKKPGKKKWIRRDIQRPGRYRKLMERYGWVRPGESIPADIKKAGCLNPEETYKILFNRKVKNARLFQKQSCLARTFKKLPEGHRGPAKRYRATLTYENELFVVPEYGTTDGLRTYLSKNVPFSIQARTAKWKEEDTGPEKVGLIIRFRNDNEKLRILAAIKDYHSINRYSAGNPLHAIYRAAAKR
jgi:hypothetical protein